MDDVLMGQVLEDLRQRGFRIEGNIGESILAVKGSRLLIHVMVEGREVPIRKLVSVIDSAEKMGLPLVIALVGNDGTITYYKAHRVRLHGKPKGT